MKLVGMCNYGQCPGWEHLGIDTPDAASFPAHIKNVEPLDIAAILRLPAAHGENSNNNNNNENNNKARINFKKSLRFITEIPVGIHKGRAIDAKMAEDEIQRMLEVKQLEETLYGDTRAYVNMFTVAEYVKKRRRVIKHTKAFNALYGRDTLVGIELINILNLVKTVHDGTYSISFDFSAFFDQFEIAHKVRPYFCFPAHGRWYRLTRLPMGMRQSNDIAHSATECIVDFEMPKSVKVTSYVDNVRFIGTSLEEVIEAAATFIVRCHKVRATINDVSTTEDLQTAKAIARDLVRTSEEFLGVEFDYINKKVAVGRKALAKLRLLLSRVEDPTLRITNQNVLAIFGILFFALQVTKHMPAKRYYAIREYSELSRRIQKDPNLLSAEFKCAPSRMRFITQWMSDVANVNDETKWLTVPQVPPPDLADFILVTDASRWGWGAVLMNQFGRIRVAYGRWGDFGGGRRSAWSEPEAIARAMLHFFPKGTQYSIAVLTDSSTAQGAFEKGRSGKYIVNRSILSVQEAFLSWNVSFHHISGVTNPADPVSRGKGLGSDQAVTAEIRRLVLGLTRKGGPDNEKRKQSANVWENMSGNNSLLV